MINMKIKFHNKIYCFATNLTYITTVIYRTKWKNKYLYGDIERMSYWLEIIKYHADITYSHKNFS